MAFWRRHTWSGVALCVVLPAIVVVHTATSPAGEHPWVVYLLAAAVAVPAPLLLLVPIEAVVAHRHGRWFFDVWEAVGIALVVVFALLDGGAGSPYVMFFYVLLAHAALAYPPAAMVLAGACNVAGYVVVGLVGGGATAQDLLVGALTMMVATATCAFASSNHVRLYRRTVAYAQQLAVAAERDGLTGCLNHRTFHERVEAEVVLAAPEHPVSLLLIDVDDFKAVNDEHGHPAGDAVLQQVGRTISGLGRAGDAAGRLGGDEFALLLPGPALEEAVAVAERVREQVRLLEQAVTVSIGVATSAVRAEGAGLLAAADRQVYRAKRAGRDRVACAADGAGAGLGTSPRGAPAPAGAPAERS